MANFDFLNDLEISSDSKAEYAEYAIRGVDPDQPVVIVVKPGTEDNKSYYTELTRRIMKNRRALQNNANMLAEQREYDRELYPKHVIVGWRNMPDSSGNEAKFSVENCKAFLQAYPNRLFDQLREFASTADNFSAVSVAEAQEAAKNSESGSGGS